jgi:hypothetical protein
VMAASAPAAWQAPTGGLSGSTQTGPTSITVHQTKSPNRRRLLGLGLVAGVLLLGTSAFLWFGRSVPAALPATSAVAAPPPPAPTQTALPSANEVAPVVVPASVPTPTVSAAAPPPARVGAAPRPGSQRNQARATASVARPGPPPAAPPPAAPPARPPARPNNPVDLAF